MTLNRFNLRPLTHIDACREYLARRGVLDRLRELRGMSAARHERELGELNRSLESAMQSLTTPSLEDETRPDSRGAA